MIEQVLLWARIGLGIAVLVELVKKDWQNAAILAALLAIITFTVQ
jgi:hypothetical protein